MDRSTFPDIINKLLVGDCLEIMREIPDKSVDLVFYDPPYNVKKKYDGYSDNLPIEQYKEWMIEVAKESHRISKEGICVYVGSKLTKLFFDILPDSHLIVVHKRAAGVFSGNYMLQYHSLFSTKRPVVKCLDLWNDVRLPGEGYFFREQRYDSPGLTGEALVDKILYYFSREGDLILDPFMGTGTTASACIKSNRKFIGIEQSPYYVKIAEERLSNVK